MSPAVRSMSSKLAAIALLAAVCGIAWLGVVVPILDTFRANGLELENAAKIYERYRALADRAEELSRATGEEQAHTGEDGTLAGGSEAIVQANLQTIVQTVAAGSGASFLSAQAAAPKNEDGVDYQGVQVVISGELSKIAQVVQNLDAHRPYLFVDRLEMRRQGVATDEEIYLPVTLDVTLDVFAARTIASGDAGAGP